MSFTPKPSKAMHWWLGILITVLVVLFFQTTGRPSNGLNLIINAGTDSQGADVIIDGKKRGEITVSSNHGPGGGTFWGYLNRGKHTVELRKSGFQPFSKEIEMHGEEYLGVDLKPAKD